MNNKQELNTMKSRVRHQDTTQVTVKLSREIYDKIIDSARPGETIYVATERFFKDCEKKNLDHLGTTRGDLSGLLKTLHKATEQLTKLVDKR